MSSPPAGAGAAGAAVGRIRHTACLIGRREGVVPGVIQTRSRIEMRGLGVACGLSTIKFYT